MTAETIYMCNKNGLLASTLSSLLGSSQELLRASSFLRLKESCELKVKKHLPHVLISLLHI